MTHSIGIRPFIDTPYIAVLIDCALHVAQSEGVFGACTRLIIT